MTPSALVDPGSRGGGRARRLDDGSLPPAGELARLLALQVLVPAMVWLAVLAGTGYLLGNQLKDTVAVEDGLIRWLAAGRTPAWNAATNVMSIVANTGTIIVTMAAAAFVIWLMSRRLREPLALVVGVITQSMVFLLTTLLIDRPRPEVPKLDESPPTSSFPSGHTGASTALYVGLAIICATRLERRWLRVVTATGFAIVPLLVATARLYRGMHHPSDVVFGLLNGLVCVLIARHALLRRD